MGIYTHMPTTSVPIKYTKIDGKDEANETKTHSREIRESEDNQGQVKGPSELIIGSQLPPSSSYDLTSSLGTKFTIDEQFKSILKDQIKEYISILKKLELGKIEQLSPEKIVRGDFVPGDIYERVKKQFEDSKDKYDTNFYEFIESQFKAGVFSYNETKNGNKNV